MGAAIEGSDRPAAQTTGRRGRRGRSSPTVCSVQVGGSCETRSGQPASQSQTGACRRCGLAVRQPCRRHEGPVGATDLSATGRRAPTDRVRTNRRMRSVPGCQRQERSTPTVRPSARRMKRSTPTARLCPVCEAINSTRRTGAQRKKDQRQTPTAGRGLRTKGLSLRPSARAACEGFNHSAAAAFPRGRPWERESTFGRTRATGITHPGFYGRKPWKKPNSATIIAAPGAAKEGLQRPFQRFRPNRSQKLTANPPHLRPGYLHQSPRVRRLRSSRFLRALRVS